MTLVESHPLVGKIHDALLDRANGDVTTAYDDAVCWLAELQEQVSELEGLISAGYMRRDTSYLYAMRVEIKFPPSGDSTSDDWIQTGVERE